MTTVMGLALVTTTLPAATASAGSARCTSTAREVCEGHVTLADGWRLPYYRNHPLAGSLTATRAVVAVHGSYRDARATFATLLAAAHTAGVDDHTILIVPRFETAADRPANREPRWTSAGWKQGNGATAPRGLSSFAVMDEVLTRLEDRRRFPNLTHIVLCGHSAGGQYVQRYAAVGRGGRRGSGVTISYVVANPSSYLYLTPDRPDPTDESGRRFAVPSTTCPFNDYKFGLQRPNAYLRRLSQDAIRSRYAGRRVTYLLGERDTRHDSMLDVTCGARWEGDNRLQRGRLFYRYVRTQFPRAPHTLVEVPGAGHSSPDMFKSARGRSALFADS